MRVLEVVSDPPAVHGGMAGSTAALIRGLQQRGHEVRVNSPRKRYGEFKFSRIPLSSGRGFDIVHLHGPTPLLSDAYLLLRRDVPIVYTHHAEISFLSENVSRIYREIHHVISRRARAILVESEEYAGLFRGQNVRVIRPPVRLSVMASQSSPGPRFSRFTVLFVGQFRPYKGIDVLLAAARGLPNVEFRLVGAGYLEPRIRRWAQSCHNVQVLGTMPDHELAQTYQRAHVICIPSINTTEAFCLALVEGAVNGCVPVSTDILGVRQTLQTLAGVSVPPKSRGGLREALLRLASDESDWAEKSRRSQEAALAYCKTNSPEAYLEQHLEVFDMVSSHAAGK